MHKSYQTPKFDFIFLQKVCKWLKKVVISVDICYIKSVIECLLSYHKVFNMSICHSLDWSANNKCWVPAPVWVYFSLVSILSVVVTILVVLFRFKVAIRVAEWHPTPFLRIYQSFDYALTIYPLPYVFVLWNFLDFAQPFRDQEMG